MEADLSRFYGIDYRDRWRTDATGRPLLTLRMIGVRVRHLPGESATAGVLRNAPEWRTEHTLLADIWQQVARSTEPHPALKAVLAGQSDNQHRHRRITEARRRARARRQAIERGEIT